LFECFIIVLEVARIAIVAAFAILQKNSYYTLEVCETTETFLKQMVRSMQKNEIYWKVVFTKSLILQYIQNNAKD